MSLHVGTTTPIGATITRTEIATYTASTGDVLRGWYVMGETKAFLDIEIDATIIDVGRLNLTLDHMYKPFPPVELQSGEVVKIFVTKDATGASEDFRGVIY